MRAGVDLQIRPESTGRQGKQGVSFRGFFAERVIVGGAVTYDFNWVGDRQYVAIHDIEMKESEIQVSGGTSTPVTDLRGRLTYAPQGCSLSGWASTVDRENSFASITFDTDALTEELEHKSAILQQAPLVHFRDTTLESTMWKLDAALKASKPVDALYLETVALSALLELAQVSAEGALVAPQSGRLSATTEKRIKDFVQSHADADLSLSEMADVAGLSRFHFSRAFKATFGLSPRDYVLWTRAHAAKDLLTQTGLPIPDIARQVGFTNPDRLTTAFKRFVGLTPSQFRRSIK